MISKEIKESMVKLIMIGYELSRSDLINNIRKTIIIETISVFTSAMFVLGILLVTTKHGDAVTAGYVIVGTALAIDIFLIFLRDRVVSYIKNNTIFDKDTDNIPMLKEAITELSHKIKNPPILTEEQVMAVVDWGKQIKSKNNGEVGSFEYRLFMKDSKWRLVVHSSLVKDVLDITDIGYCDG